MKILYSDKVQWKSAITQKLLVQILLPLFIFLQQTTVMHYKPEVVGSSPTKEILVAQSDRAPFTTPEDSKILMNF